MGEESDKARELAEVKEYIERRLEELKSEISLLEKLKKFIDDELARVSFKKAVEVKPVERIEKTPPQESAGARVLRSKTGEILARVITSPNELRFIIDEGVNLTRDSKPFQSFLVKKVFEAMNKSDLERIDRGLIPPGHELTYEVIYDGDRIKEILVRNFREEYRLREIINAVRWTLETVAASGR
ncbi:MAG: hypothetical protein N3F65_00015 [Nitrososphaeria archaeon]|nr:hypothetical protein [Aigarchaeota archaeon]MCX8186986.1 hypothetical protein [Nitrososphaeria archaeon]MDW8021478.1 hypothetical protein [Nitrososphaerota archaeon]